MDLFDFNEEAKKDMNLYSWDYIVPNEKYKVILVWKDFSEDNRVSSLNKKMVEKIANISMISIL